MHGMTKLRRLRTSSWNSGDRSIASQSIRAICGVRMSTGSPLSMSYDGCRSDLPARRGSVRRSAALALALARRAVAGDGAGVDAAGADRLGLGLDRLAALPRPRPSGAARAARRSSATARPAGPPRRRVAARPAAEEEDARASAARSDWTTGSGPPSGRTSSAPVMMPSTPMKRVSRPTRIALSEMSTSASASRARRAARAAGRTAPSPLGADVRAPRRPSVGPARKSLIAACVAIARQHRRDRLEDGADERQVDDHACGNAGPAVRGSRPRGTSAPSRARGSRAPTTTLESERPRARGRRRTGTCRRAATALRRPGRAAPPASSASSTPCARQVGEDRPRQTVPTNVNSAASAAATAAPRRCRASHARCSSWCPPRPRGAES